MRILVCAINYAPDLIGVPKYNTELCEDLVDRGHEVRIVTAPPYYPDWKVPPGHSARRYVSERRNGVAVERAPIYVPARPSGSRRLLHHASFALTSLAPALAAAVAWRPDVVFAVAPSLLSAPVAAAAARLCGAWSWLHVQDFEVDAAFELGLLRNARARALMTAAERRILRAFDRVSTISPQMLRRLRDKGVGAEAARELRNWVDIAAIRPGSTRTGLRTALGLGSDDVVALYSGSMSSKQGLDIVVDAARSMSEARPDVHFVLCGNGPYRDELTVQSHDLRNVHFLPLQPLERLDELLATADIHLLPQRAQAADLVLPSKLAGMLASGRPIVAMAEPGTGIAMEADGAGLVITPGDAGALRHAVATLADDPALRRKLGDAARRRAEHQWDRTAIIAAFERELVALARRRRIGKEQATVETPAV